MIQRLYVNNFRCLENFTLELGTLSSALLIGKNGAGKSTICFALELFQSIGRGKNRIRELFAPRDISFGREGVPVRFEIEVLLEGLVFQYSLALEMPENFKELRVLEENLIISGTTIYTRQQAQVTLHSRPNSREAQFLVDWHLIALPVIQQHSAGDPLQIFKNWLARMILLTPVPILMKGESDKESLDPDRTCYNFGNWISGVLGQNPAAYTQIDKFLRDVMPDIQDFLNQPTGKESKSLVVRFELDGETVPLDFEVLSDGEKCFFVCAVLLAFNRYYGPIFCFWDEPDNYLSLSEVGHFLVALRKSFKDSSQVLVTSHNPEAIRSFSDENTFVLDRKSHLEPTLVRLLKDLPIEGDLVNALSRGDINL